jgi:hypothetical protein
MLPTLLDHFDSIRIISLPERKDRRRQVGDEMARAGCPIGSERVQIVDGIRPADAGSFPSIGARGCFASHLAVLRFARAEGARHVLVLEDDVMFTPALARSGGLASTVAIGDWDFLYPGHAEPTVDGPLQWIPTRTPMVCAHCYAVNERAYDRVIAYLEACMRRPSGHPDGGPMHVDGAFSMLRQRDRSLVTLRASRSIAGQRSSRSDIEGPTRADASPLAPLVDLARNAKNWWRRHRAA